MWRAGEDDCWTMSIIVIVITRGRRAAKLGRALFGSLSGYSRRLTN